MGSDITEPAFCDDHGMMVPCGSYFAFAPKRDGLVTAIVLWDKPDRYMTDEGYAPSAELRSQLPSVREAGLGERIYELQQTKRLFPCGPLYRRVQCYRIDDNRPWHNWGYMVALEQSGRGLRLMPRTVYYFFSDSETDSHRYPALTRFDDVVALMAHPNRLLISDVGELAGLDRDDPRVQQRWKLENRVVVYDLSAIERNS